MTRLLVEHGPVGSTNIRQRECHHPLCSHRGIPVPCLFMNSFIYLFILGGVKDVAKEHFPIKRQRIGAAVYGAIRPRFTTLTLARQRTHVHAHTHKRPNFLHVPTYERPASCYKTLQQWRILPAQMHLPPFPASESTYNNDAASTYRKHAGSTWGYTRRVCRTK
jgi:hypothetical protein